MHCKMVLNKMEDKYAGSTIRQAYITMGTMLKSALMNDLVAKHPMNGVRYTKPVRAVEHRHKQGCWRAGPPKTKQSYRTIPLTKHAYETLEQAAFGRNSRKESGTLSQILEYIDRRNARSCIHQLENLQKTALMTRTYISCVMKLGSGVFVCTRFDTHTLQERLRAVCSPRCCTDAANH